MPGYERSKQLQELMDAACNIKSYDEIFEWGINLSRCITNDSRSIDIPNVNKIRQTIRNMVLASEKREHGMFFTWADEALTIVSILKRNYHQ